MFIISLTYTADLSEIDKHLFAHLEWLKTYYDQDIFIVSGRKNPPSGGVIVAHNITREALEKIIIEDPFNQNNIADFEIIEFTPRMKAKEMDFIKEPA